MGLFDFLKNKKKEEYKKKEDIAELHTGERRSDKMAKEKPL